jgi:hypothetical protein
MDNQYKAISCMGKTIVLDFTKDNKENKTSGTGYPLIHEQVLHRIVWHCGLALIFLTQGRKFFQR